MALLTPVDSSHACTVCGFRCRDGMEIDTVSECDCVCERGVAVCVEMMFVLSTVSGWRSWQWTE